MIVVSGLTDDLMGAHIHEGAAGANGSVVFDLTPMFSNGGMFTYWSDMSSTVFTDSIAKKMQDEMLYVNVHTATYPGGEIRGQIIRDVSCEFTTAVDYATIGEGNLTIQNVFPTPALSVVNVLFKNDRSSDLQISVFDMTGKMMMDKTLFAFQNESQLEVIHIQNWSAGMYFIRISNDEQTVTTKFTK